VLEGRCLNWGYYCAGRALQSPRNQTCPRCGIGLEITENGWSISTGYSPFSADKYSIELCDNVSFFHDEE
jgi:hypothetical protein